MARVAHRPPWRGRASSRRRARSRRIIAASGVFDLEWFEAQVGRDFRSERAAIREYVRTWSPSGASPHPLFCPEWVSSTAEWEQSGLDPLSWYLSTPEIRDDREPHPVLRLPALRRQAGGDGSPWGLFASWNARAGHKSRVRMFGSVTRWGRLRRHLLEAAREVALSPDDGRPPTSERDERDRVSTSVVVVVGEDVRSTIQWLRALRGLPDTEVVVVVSRERLNHYLTTLAVTTFLERSRVLAVPGDATYAEVVDTGVSASEGAACVVVGPMLAPAGEWVPDLVGVLADDDVALAQPLELDDRGLVAGAGASFTAGGTVLPFLREHRAVDAEGVGRTVVPLPHGNVLAFRRSTFDAVGGFVGTDAFTAAADFARRAEYAGLGRCVLEPRCRVVHREGASGPPPPRTTTGLSGLPGPAAPVPADAHETTVALWRRAGFELLAQEASGGPAGEGEERPSVRRARAEAVHEHPPSLRWALDIAAPSHSWGRRWGDTVFAESLAEALRARGQVVSVDFRDARSSPSRLLDDVVLVLRGLDEVAPPTGPLALEWIISHPDLVTAQEAARFDLVFAASATWAADASRAWGRTVEPLLQCTDASIFHPRPEMGDQGHQVLFVGNSRGSFRRCVRGALASGLPVTVYGTGWEPFLPPEQVHGEHVPNHELGGLYSSAGVVLNDHWEDMRRLGFISNRIFDAVACGARVLTDDVAGIQEVFGDAVCVYHSEEELAELLARPWDETFPSRATRLAAADRVLTEHTFAARAATLLDAATRILRERA